MPELDIKFVEYYKDGMHEMQTIFVKGDIVIMHISYRDIWTTPKYRKIDESEGRAVAEVHDKILAEGFKVHKNAFL